MEELKELEAGFISHLVQSPLEYYVGSINDHVMWRKLFVMWLRRVEESLRKGYIWNIPADLDFYLGHDGLKAPGYATLHYGHIDRPTRTEYWVVFRTDFIEGLAKGIVPIHWFCSRCYRRFIMEIRRMEPIEVPVWDHEIGFRLKSRVEPVVAYSSRWWRRKHLNRLIGIDFRLPEWEERARKVIFKKVWEKVLERRWSRHLDADDRVAILELWEEELGVKMYEALG